MILEGILTTSAADGRMHVAAMGPWVDERERETGRITRLGLRPFATSQTGAHLVRTRAGVFHLTDDVLLLARIVSGRLESPPAARPAGAVSGWVIEDACRAYEFAIDAVDDSQERLRLEARVVAEHVGRPFIGFNRAAHAVVEAAILVTRRHLLDREDILGRFADLAVLVDKTGGSREHEAFDLLAARVAEV